MPTRLLKPWLLAAAAVALAATGPGAARAQILGQKMEEDCLGGALDPRQEIASFPASAPRCEFQSYGAVVSFAASEAEPICQAQCTKTRPVAPNGSETYLDQACLAECRPREAVRFEKEALETCLGDLQARLADNERVLGGARAASKREHDRVDLSGLAKRDEKLAYYSQGNILCNATKATIGMGNADGAAALAQEAIQGLSAPGGGGKAFEHLQRLEGGFQRVDEIIAKMDPRAAAAWGWTPSSSRPGKVTKLKRGAGEAAGDAAKDPGDEAGKEEGVGSTKWKDVKAELAKSTVGWDFEKKQSTIGPLEKAILDRMSRLEASKTATVNCDVSKMGGASSSSYGYCETYDPKNPQAGKLVMSTRKSDGATTICAPGSGPNFPCVTLPGTGGAPGPTTGPPQTDPGSEPSGGRQTFFKTITDEELLGEVEGQGPAKKTETSLAGVPGFKAMDCRFKDCGRSGPASASAAAPAVGAFAQYSDGAPGGTESGSPDRSGSASARAPRWGGLFGRGQGVPVEGFPEKEPDSEEDPEPDEEPSRDPVRRLLADAERALGLREWSKALERLTKVIELDPKNEEARTMRSILYNLLKQHIEAEQDARAALELNPKNVKAWISLAWALLRQGRYREAAEAASQAIALDPNNAFAYRIRAEAREALGDDAGKLEDLARAAALDARFKALYESVKRGGRIADDRADAVCLFLDCPQRREASRPLPLVWLLAGGAALLVLAGMWAVRSMNERSVARARERTGAETATRAGAPGLFGRYELLRPLGTSGRLFVGADPSSGTTVLLRRTGVPEKDRREAVRAAERWKALSHPAVAKVLDAALEGGELWLVVEFVEGESLEESLARRGRLTLEQAAGRLGPVCHAVQAAHEKGLAHGNLRPSKLLVAKDGRTIVTSFLLPGEAGAEAASAQADVSMLASCLGRLLAGPGGAADGLAPEAQALLKRALHPDPARRFTSAAELSRAVRDAATAAGRAPVPGRVPFASGGDA